MKFKPQLPRRTICIEKRFGQTMLCIGASTVLLACVASVAVRKKGSQTIFRKLAARKMGQETEGTLARRPPIFEKRLPFLD